MSLFRTETNLETGDYVEIAQKAYRSDSDSEVVVVLDAFEPVPEGFTEFDPSVIEAVPL